MSRVLALVEGQTEQTFVRDVLAPELGAKGVFVTATLVGKPGRKGGVRGWKTVRRELVRLLGEDRNRYCTTMFDYYGLPAEWPGVGTARSRPFRQAVAEIERAIYDAISEKMQDDMRPDHFIPYVQLHEFEALLFSDPNALATALSTPSLQRGLEAILEQCGEPEGIDDDSESAPSKRISRLAPAYQKVVHGSIVAKRIELTRMREKCPHFGEWVDRIERLGELDSA